MKMAISATSTSTIFSLFLRYFPLLWELREAMRSLMRLGKKGLF